jgi:hypothetical protein
VFLIENVYLDIYDVSFDGSDNQSVISWNDFMDLSADDFSSLVR